MKRGSLKQKTTSAAKEPPTPSAPADASPARE